MLFERKMDLNTNIRRNQLEEIIKNRKEVDISELNNMFDVSSVTIRNDLIALERKNVIKRTFGKVYFRDDSFQYPHNSVPIKNIAEKERIAKYAATLINPDDSVLFYTGSTTLQIIRYIDPAIQFVAVTNSIWIAQELRILPNVKTIFIGGNFNHQIGATYGLEAISQIQKYNIDKLFLAVDGIDSEVGITNRLSFENDLNHIMLAQCKECIVVADYSKVGQLSFVKMGDITEIDILITDSKASEEQVNKIRQKGVAVVVT